MKTESGRTIAFLVVAAVSIGLAYKLQPAKDITPEYLVKLNVGKDFYADFNPNEATSIFVAGFDEATGYGASGPVRIGLAFPDAIGGLHGAFATVQALWERALTGGPVHVDVSQFESLLSIAGEMLLVTSATGHSPDRHGNPARPQV